MANRDRGRGVEREFLAIEQKCGWQPLFMEIREKSANFSIADSKRLENRDLNRYRDVNPFDHSRVNVTRGTCAYINASLVKVQAVDRMYILTQGPLSSTVSHFWAMVWEQSCKAIVMLNNVIEKNQVKCHTYWPVAGQAEGNLLNLQDVRLSVELLQEDHRKNYTLRTFKMVDLDSEEFRIVYQYHYTTWPDFGVPAAPSDFLQFLMDIRQSGALGPSTVQDTVGPAVIHCSAGIGRSGTFCIVDTALLLLERGQRFDIKELVLEMRRYRMGLIQTAEQLRFSYLAIIEGAEQVQPHPNGAAAATQSDEDLPSEESCSDEETDDDDDEDEEDSDADEVEEEDDVVAGDGDAFHVVAEEIFAVPDVDDVPPPIPPRAESLHSPASTGDYDALPLPAVPDRKRPRAEAEEAPATPSESEDGEETMAVAAGEADAAVGLEGSDSERRKRRKAADGTGDVEEEEAEAKGGLARSADPDAKELPPVPEEEEASPRTAVSDIGAAGVRQRRQERVERTNQLIASIKEKQHEAETRQKRRGVLGARFESATKWLGLGVGLGVVVLLCAGVRYFHAAA